MTLPALLTEIMSSMCSPLLLSGPHHIHEGLTYAWLHVPSFLVWGTHV